MTENEKKTDADIKVRNPESIGITVKHVLDEIAVGISSSDFQQLITILKNRSSIANTLYNMRTADIINDNCQIVDKMYSETGLDGKYSEITNLINDSTADKNSLAWRPATGDCNLQLAAHRKRCLIEKKKKLEKLVEEQRSKRLLLKKSLDLKRARIASQLKHMAIAKKKLYRNSENYF